MLNRKPVVLLIENDENVNAANRQILVRKGYAVRVARGIVEARRLAGEPAELAILDIDLPDGDGLSFLPELRTLVGGVLVLSGNKGTADKAVESGARGFIGKPYRLEELCLKVNALAGPTAAHQRAQGWDAPQLTYKSTSARRLQEISQGG